MKHEYPTYTLQDIMQKLPPSINICMLHIYKAADLWYFVYMDSYDGDTIEFYGGTITYPFFGQRSIRDMVIKEKGD